MSGLKFAKPPRGSHVLERKAKRRAIESAEDANKRKAKKRDGYRCRWPEKHECIGGLESAHIEDKGMGGDHGLRSDTSNLITVCAWIHRRGPESIHGKQLEITPQTAAGTDGACTFWRRVSPYAHAYMVVARERSIGVLEREP